MRWIKFVAMLGCFGPAMVGCAAHIGSQTKQARLDAPPSVESIGDFLDAIEFDDLANRLVSAEKSVVEYRISQSRAKSSLTVAQASLCDEFIGKAMSVLDETFSRENTRRILNDTIQRSFTQRDIDALIFFYGTQSGKAIVANLKMAIRPYMEDRKTRTDPIGLDNEHDRQNQLALFFHVFSEAAESHEMSQFYGNDIDEDITSRLPNARNIYDGEVEPLEAQGQARVRELMADYKAKLKPVTTHEGTP